MTGRLGRTRRQLYALLMLALVVMALASVTVLPVYWANRYYEDTLAAMQGRLEVLQRVAATGNGLRTEYEQLKRHRATDRHYLKSSSEPLAAAELQRLLKRIAMAQKMEVFSIQNLPAAEEHDFTRVALKVRMRGTLENIVGLFYTLESGEPFLFMEHISLRRFALKTRSASPAQQTLEADFELVGYIPQHE
jgi:hypothetical protein